MSPNTDIDICPIRKQDLPEVQALWKECGLHPSRSDTPTRLEEVVKNLGNLFLIAWAGDEIVGSIMGSFDGRRGWINRLAVHPRLRGRGLGQKLLREVEETLRARGCDKVNLLIEPENESVQAYYEQRGYRCGDLIFMEKWFE